MLRGALAATFILLATSIPLAAQTGPGATTPASTPPAEQQSASESMEDAQIGDHWTYELRDEITGDLKSTLTHTVTDVSPTEISIRLGTLGTSNVGYLTYSRSWDLVSSSTWRFTPNDGTGIRPPLGIGKTWSIRSAALSSPSGASWRHSGTSKVSAQESIATPAGKFDTFKIETSIQTRNANDPTKKFTAEQLVWYAPAINHWVKRSYTLRSDGKVREKTTIELVEYGRR